MLNKIKFQGLQWDRVSGIYQYKEKSGFLSLVIKYQSDKHELYLVYDNYHVKPRFCHSNLLSTMKTYYSEPTKCGELEMNLFYEFLQRDIQKETILGFEFLP